MTRTSYQTGMDAESEALDFLQQQGLIFNARNVRFKGGEIDLVMQHKQTRVFVEVRYRKSNRYGSALESITISKQQRLIRSALLYNQRYPTSQPWRIDVISITAQTADSARSLEWLQSAISA
jgi:putative endonuclease